MKLYRFWDHLGNGNIFSFKELPIKYTDSSPPYSDDFISNKAKDGKIDKRGSFASKQNEKYPWLELELFDVKVVECVKIINVDWQPQRLNNVEVRVGNFKAKTTKSRLDQNDICFQYRGPGKRGEKIMISCSSDLVGRYVTIQMIEGKFFDDGNTDELSHTWLLQIAEVYIIGKQIGSSNQYQTSNN